MSIFPPPAFADSTGQAASVFVNDVRDGLEDYPEPKVETWTADGVNGPLAVAAAPLKILYPKIYGSATANTPLVRDNTTATNFTVIDSGTPSAGEVLVNYNLGTIQFASAPATNDVIQVEYQTVRWSDTQILTGLAAGLRAMFPVVGRTYVDTSIPIQVDVWDYTLPAWFQDPRSRLISLEVADPFIPTEPFKPAPGGAERIGISQIHLPWAQRYSPTARLRITGWGPYLELGDLEPQLYHLPIWYCLSVLLPKREAKRIREDTQIPLTGSGGQQPTLNLQTGDYYARRFEAELARLARLPGPTSSRPTATVYQRRRY